MKIQLVSFLLDLEPSEKIGMMVDIINQSKADFILFPGSTTESIEEALDMMPLIRNNKVTVVFEVASLYFSDFEMEMKNCPFLIQNKKLINMHTHQFFIVSDTIENNDVLAESFVYELETRRQIKVKNYNFLLFLCGENNIIKNIQAEDNKPVIRINDKQVAKRFKEVLHRTDVVINYIHQPQYGNQNKLHKRREYLSKGGKYYFSTNNCEYLSDSAKSVQYAYHNGKEMNSVEPVINEEGYMYRIFEI